MLRVFLIQRHLTTGASRLCRQSHSGHVSLFRHYSASAKREDPDIIVVGSGVAGVSASIAAAEQGASVVMLDASHGGGATAMSGGVVYAGGGTEYQKAAGYGDDTPENMFRYLKEETKDAVDEQTLRDFCDGSVSRLKWMERHGARFEGSLCPYKTSYPTDEHYLYFSGNETCYPYNKIAEPAPRGHRMASPGLSGGALWQPLFESATKLGVRVLPASKVERILLNDRNAVGGVEFKHLEPSTKAFRRHRSLTNLGKRLQLVIPNLAAKILDRADTLWDRDTFPSRLNAPAVILAAGGFGFNPAMRQQYAPEFAKVAPLGTRGDDGSGIRLGQSVGGSVAKMENMSAWRFLYPPTALLEGVVVSQVGNRFIAEDIYGATMSDKMIRDHDNKAFLILDSVQWTKAKSQLSKQTQSPLSLQRRHWLMWDHIKTSSIDDLAAKLDLPPDALHRTVVAYNDAIARGEEDPMHKEAKYCTPILNPPFYGIDISSRVEGIQAVYGLTLGGLRVDGKSGLVLREDDSCITGLYAAGRNAVGICSNGYVSGLSIADGVFSGMRAGEHAAKHCLVI
ncbi:FAD binding domain-containing protein [Aspergillus egyptiacus]|nr:FAD binding domain-containing protein [Aspergillus egyptiacus]